MLSYQEIAAPDLKVTGDLNGWIARLKARYQQARRLNRGSLAM